MGLSKRVVEAFLDGEEKATETVYLEFKNLMYFIIASYVPSKEDCDDLLSESFMKAIEHRSEMKDPSKIKAFFSTIARNSAINFLKKKSDVP